MQLRVEKIAGTDREHDARLDGRRYVVHPNHVEQLVHRAEIENIGRRFHRLPVHG